MITVITCFFFLHSENMCIESAQKLWYIVMRSKGCDFDNMGANGPHLWELPLPPLCVTSIVPFIMDIQQRDKRKDNKGKSGNPTLPPSKPVAGHLQQ